MRRAPSRGPSREDCYVDAELRALVERIHGAPLQAALVASGAGSQAIAWLLGVPGASRTVLEASVPYARQAMVDYLGREPAEYASAETAVALAEAARERASRQREGEAPVAGLACAATIATDRPKRGEHRAFVALASDRGTSLATLVLEKGARDRDGEEDVVSRLILDIFARECGIEDRPALPLLTSEHVDERSPARP